MSSIVKGLECERRCGSQFLEGQMFLAARGAKDERRWVLWFLGATFLTVKADMIGGMNKARRTKMQERWRQLAFNITAEIFDFSRSLFGSRNLQLV